MQAGTHCTLAVPACRACDRPAAYRSPALLPRTTSYPSYASRCWRRRSTSAPGASQRLRQCPPSERFMAHSAATCGRDPVANANLAIAICRGTAAPPAASPRPGECIRGRLPSAMRSSTTTRIADAGPWAIVSARTQIDAIRTPSLLTCSLRSGRCNPCAGFPGAMTELPRAVPATCSDSCATNCGTPVTAAQARAVGGASPAGWREPSADWTL